MVAKLLETDKLNTQQVMMATKKINDKVAQLMTSNEVLEEVLHILGNTPLGFTIVLGLTGSGTTLEARNS